MIRLIELTTGQLMIVLGDKETLHHLNNELRLTDEDVLEGFMETCKYIGNDWYVNQTIGLTEAPNICKGGVSWRSVNSSLFEEYLHYIESNTEHNEHFKPLSYHDYVNQHQNINDGFIDFEHIWYYPHYMTKSFVEELLAQGFVIFEKA
jgi:hypothetical protein